MKNESEFKPGTEIECDSHIILAIPRDIARLKIEATLLDENGCPHICETVLGPEDIRQARQDFLDYVEFGDDYDARYVLSEKGREMLERMEDGDSIDWEDLID